MTSNKIISILIDNLRIDSFSDKDFSRKFYPNFSFLIRNGIFKELIANAHTTKFVIQLYSRKHFRSTMVDTIMSLLKDLKVLLN